MDTLSSPAASCAAPQPQSLNERDAWWRFVQLKDIAYRSEAQESEMQRLRERLLRIGEAWRFAQSAFPD